MNMWDMWSKTRQDDPSDWHALPWHLVEVGAVAEQIWRSIAPAHIKERFAERLGVDDPDLIARWVGFVTAIHDIGKISPKFQGLVPVQVERLKGLEQSIATVSDRVSLKHGLISAAKLPGILQDLFGMEPRASRRYAYLTGGHHGVMWSQSAIKSVDLHPKPVGRAPWDAARREAVVWLAEVFGIPNPLPGKMATERLSYEESVWLAGLITASDWLGSDEYHFRYRTDVVSAQEARAAAKERTDRAMIKTGWFQRPVKISAATFGEAIHSLPKGAEPYPAQNEAIRAIQSMSGPGIAVVEYPMGWGKTEIALWAAAHWANTSRIPGFYVAMPTMTTSDQLFDRVTAHLQAHLGERKEKVNLQLLHGQAALSARPEITADGEFDKAVASLAKVRDPEDGADGRIQRATWFTRRKRGLLATYGVGTVDQVLMSVLQTKHFFVRTHGLGGKTIIFDEVHSYDVYMSELFDAVLAWLGALGSPVVILSATLPAERTREMIAAYQRGAGWEVSAPVFEPYPRITVADQDGARSCHGPSPEHEKSRTVALRMCTTDVDDETIWSEIGPQLDFALKDGGTAAVICNTVRQAQDAWLALGQWFAPEERTLFHARFRQKDRRGIQKNVLDRFGKDVLKDDNDLKRPHRHVVIATQVIEQSLDLDFDMMISMFCPTDLLLQRMGRMQRHQALDPLRPEKFRGKTEIWVVGMNQSDGVPEFHKGSTRVYDTHVLIRSWLALQGRNQIVIPDDVEALIEATYGDVPMVPDNLERAWTESFKKWKKSIGTDEDIAESVLIPSLESGNDPHQNDVLAKINHIKENPEDEPFMDKTALAQTRLGDPSVSLVILKADEAAQFGDAINASGEEPLTLEQVHPLLIRSLSVSLHNVVQAAKNTPEPKAWAQTAHLRHHRLVILDEHNRGFLGELRVELHPVLGARFDKDVEEGDGSDE